MRLTDKQLKRFTEVFEIKAKSIIMIDKGRKVTIIISSVRIFDVKRSSYKSFFNFVYIMCLYTCVSNNYNVQ